MKTILIVLAVAGIGIAMSDLATGKSSTPILGATITNQLTQEIDVALLVSGAISLFYALNYAS